MPTKRAKPASNRSLLKEVSSLKATIKNLFASLDSSTDENLRNRVALHHAIDIAHDSANKLSGLRGELAMTSARLSDLERRVLAFLDNEQREIVKVMGISGVDYALCHFKELHNNRHLIELTKEHRSH